MKKLILLAVLCTTQFFAHGQKIDEITEKANILKAFTDNENQLLKVLSSDTASKFLGDIDMRFWIEAIQTQKKSEIKPQTLFAKKSAFTNEADVVMDSMKLSLHPDLELPFSGGIVRCTYNEDMLCTRMEATVNLIMEDKTEPDSAIILGALEIGYDNNDNINMLEVWVNDEDTLVKQAKVTAVYNTNGDLTNANAYILMDYDDVALTQMGSLDIVYDVANRITNVLVNAYDYDIEELQLVLIANAEYNAASLPVLTEVVIYESSEDDYEGIRLEWTYISETIDELIMSALDNDSAWVEGYKLDYDYDVNGNVTAITEFEYDGAWVYDYKNEFTYTDFGKIAQSKYLRYNTDSSRWINNSIDSFAYNANQQLEVAASYYWTNYGQLNYFYSYSSKDAYEYDANGRIVLWTNYNGNTSYNLDSETLEVTIEKSWVVDEKIEYDRNDDGKIACARIYEYDSFDDTLTLYMKDTVTYDNQGRPNGFEQYYRENDSTMVGEVSLQIDRDGNNNLSYFKFQVWNDTLADWDGYIELLVEYNNEAELLIPEFEIPEYIEKALKKVAKANGIDVDSLRSDFYPNPILSAEFFGYNSIDDILADFQINNLPTKLTVNVDIDTVQMDEMGVCNMYYSNMIIGFEEENNELAQPAVFYPNPANNYIQFKDINGKGTFAIYSINGALVTQQTISNYSQMDISNINPGMYITTLNANGKTTNSKLIVE